MMTLADAEKLVAYVRRKYAQEDALEVLMAGVIHLLPSGTVVTIAQPPDDAGFAWDGAVVPGDVPEEEL